MRQLSLFVDGMGCRLCVRDVTARLRDVPGVQTVRADLGQGVVRLSGSMRFADVLAAFDGAVYRPRLDDSRSAVERSGPEDC